METHQPVFSDQVMTSSSSLDQQQHFVHSNGSTPNVINNNNNQPDAFPFSTTSCTQIQPKLELVSQLATPDEGQPILQQQQQQQLLQVTNALQVTTIPTQVKMETNHCYIISEQPQHQQQQQHIIMMKSVHDQENSQHTVNQLSSQYQNTDQTTMTPVQTPGLSQGIISPQSHADITNMSLHSTDQQSCNINPTPHIAVPGEAPVLSYSSEIGSMTIAHDPNSSSANNNIATTTFQVFPSLFFIYIK